MTIGIIGSGNIGATLAHLFVKAGHEVAISNSRGPASLRDLVAEIGPLARAASIEDAIAFGDVVIEAIPYGRYRDLPAAAFVGKLVVTAGNYYPQRDGEIDLAGRAQSELVAEHLAGARVVKAFNTIWYEHLQKQGDSTLFPRVLSHGTQFVGAIPTGWTTTPPIPLPKAFGIAFRMMLYAPFTSALIRRPSAVRNIPRVTRVPT
jgi:predicted dinucleotide-binding enzyme